MAHPECSKIYEEVIGGKSSDNYLLFKMAQCFLDGFEPDKLSEMLKSLDDGIVSDGLFIASEIGNLAQNYIDELRAILLRDDPELQRVAAHLLETYKREE